MTPVAAAQFTYDELTSIVGWYVDMGVDIAIDEAVHDRFSEDSQKLAAPARAPVRPPAETPKRAPLARIDALPAPASPDQAIVSAKEISARAQSLDELRAAIEAFDGCNLKRSAQRTVFADGNPQARLMFVGEAPGADEDRQGIPFVGRAGQLLDRMLKAINLDRSEVYIANAVPWRPPGNRTPTPQETAICLPFIRRQIELVGPQVLVCLGASSMQSILGVNEGILKTRGRLFDYPMDNGRKIKAMATLHPAYLLRSPAQKRLAWRDFQEIANLLKVASA